MVRKMEENANENKARSAPETKTELMRKERFDKMKEKFDSVSEEATKVIDSASPKDILALYFKFDNPVEVLNAEIITPEQFLKEAFS